MKRFACIVLLLSILATPLARAQERCTPAQARARTLEAWTLARQYFVNPKMNGVDWDAERVRALRQCAAVHTRRDSDRIVNAMLDTLHTSHTHLYSPDDVFYPYLITTFRVKGYVPEDVHHGKIMVDDVGIFPLETAEGVFVKTLLDAGPAARAGIRVGDRIVSVDGRPWRGMASWRGKAGRKVTVALQRSRGGPITRVTVTPRLWEPQVALADATRASVRVVTYGGKRIGYVHAWSFTNDGVPAAVFDALAGSLKNCDGVVLDMRDGLGGGSDNFMLPWLGYPATAMIWRNGRTTFDIPPRPRATVVLINEGSRSGKELFAYAFKASKSATLVGARTEGAVIAGRALYLKDGSFLYVAVARVHIDGHDLEGKGVEPDVPVERPIPWSNGDDPQLRAALERLSK